MPAYCYTNKATGMTVDMIFPVGKAPEKIRRETAPGIWRVFRRDYVAEHSGMRKSQAKWPMISEAMGMMDAEIPAERERIAKNNIKGVTVLDDGTVKLDSPGARRDYMRLRGYRDKDGYY